MSDVRKVQKIFEDISLTFSQLADRAQIVMDAGTLLVDALSAGGKVIFCGNGGSAADSQHLAAELMGRFMKDRPPLAALSLTVDTSALTAIANDYGYDQVFSRQLRGIGRKGDVLVGLTTSGNSRNVVVALRVAREIGIKTVSLTGRHGGAAREHSDICIMVPSERTDQIQQMHIAIGHIICGLVEEATF